MTPQTVRLAYKAGKTAYRTFKDYRNRKTAEAYDATSEVLNDAPPISVVDIVSCATDTAGDPVDADSACAAGASIGAM